MVNIIVACIFSYVNTGTEHADQCASYWSTFIINTSLCLMLNYVLLRGSERILSYRSGKYIEASKDAQGSQNAKLEWTMWAWQIAVYLAIVTFLRLLVVVVIIIPFSHRVARFGVWGTTWIPNLGIRVLWVMVLTPLSLDTLSLWVTDQFIKFVRAGGDTNASLQKPLVGTRSGGEQQM
eukprot:1476142-Amphidinium_carterae.1